MNENSQTTSSKKLPEFNVLLLGETGSGKSTTLNALANYFRYDFDGAAKKTNPFTIVEPFQITLGESGMKKTFKSGPGVGGNNNTRNMDCESQTISTVGYIFEFENRCRFRIIDSPGVGDTKGEDSDKRNFQNIFDYLNKLDELHAVVIVIKGTDNRTNKFFNYCNSELLTYLHNSVSKNIMFLFTYSRESLFDAGQAYATLESLLQNELSNRIELPLKTGTNCFYIDNESFRFLIAEKKGYKLDQVYKETLRFSWNKSVENVKKMMKQILKVDSHDLQKTKLLNEVRKIIVEFSQPIVQVELNIRKNIEYVEKLNKSLPIQDSHPDSMLESLNLELEVVKLEKIQKASTVCASEKCTQTRKSKDGTDENLYALCHEGCICPFVRANVKKQLTIMTCEAMEWSRTLDGVCDSMLPLYRICKGCGCHWTEHMHIYARYVTERVTILNADPDEVKIELQDELDTIKDCNNKFAYFLKTNSLLSHNEYYLEYLDTQIEQASHESEENENMKRTLLKQIKKDYEKNVKAFNQAIKNNRVASVRLQEIANLKNRLINLKYSGPQFKQILEVQQEMETHEDKVVSWVPESNEFFKLVCRYLSPFD